MRSWTDASVVLLPYPNHDQIPDDEESTLFSLPSLSSPSSPSPLPLPLLLLLLSPSFLMAKSMFLLSLSLLLSSPFALLFVDDAAVSFSEILSGGCTSVLLEAYKRCSQEVEEPSEEEERDRLATTDDGRLEELALASPAFWSGFLRLPGITEEDGALLLLLLVDLSSCFWHSFDAPFDADSAVGSVISQEKSVRQNQAEKAFPQNRRFHVIWVFCLLECFQLSHFILTRCLDRKQHIYI